MFFNTKKEKALEGALSNKSSSLWQDGILRFRRNKLAYYSLISLLLLTLIALIVPMFLPWKYYEIDRAVSFPSSPSLGHLFGTDFNGRDLLARVLLATKVSLLIGFVASTVSFVIGVVWGIIAGFYGGKVDQVMMRIVDVLYSLPFMFFVILLMVVFGRSLILLFIALGAISWLTMARIVRGQTIAIKNKLFVQATEVYGLGKLKVMLRHILPNLLGTIAVYLTLTIPEAILVESFLSFLGLGVQEPMTSLGVLISEGAKVMSISLWMFVVPASFLAILLFCLNFIGDGLRDAVDPKQK